MIHRWALSTAAAALLVACGSSDDTASTVDAGSNPDTSAGDASKSDSGNSQDSGNPDSSNPQDSSTGGDAGFSPTCSGTGVSSCNKPQSIVRVVSKLGANMKDVTGDLVVNLAHYRLGQGSTGGYPHNGTTKSGVTVGTNTPVEVDFDMCTGGEMWSEENCEFNLFGFVDVNKNGTLEQGEPAGRLVMNVSCKQSGAGCWGLVLDCTAGMSCVTFVDPGACKCASPGCNSPIKTCM